MKRTPIVHSLWPLSFSVVYRLFYSWLSRPEMRGRLAFRRPYADVDGIGGGVWVNFTGSGGAPMIFSRLRRHKKRYTSGGGVRRRQTIYKKFMRTL